MLARAAEEVTRLTISLHGKEATILQSDGQPIKAVRAARPVQHHGGGSQSNGGAE